MKNEQKHKKKGSMKRAISTLLNLRYSLTPNPYVVHNVVQPLANY